MKKLILLYFIFIFTLFSQDKMQIAKNLIDQLDSWYDSETYLWKTTSWWNAANILNAYIDYTNYSNDTSFSDKIGYTLDNVNPSNFINDYYDDEGWWALTLLKAYKYTKNDIYLSKTKILFEDMAKSWDNTCNGGIYWRKDHKYKNAVANELFMLIGIRLHQVGIDSIADDTAINWSKQVAEWFINSGMINDEYLVNDGLLNCKNNNGTTWTYNQGVILSAFSELYQETGDSNYIHLAIKIADATITTLVDSNGILKELNEPNSYADQTQFKGIFIRNLGVLYKVTKLERYKNFIDRNVSSILNFALDKEKFTVGISWSQKPEKADASTQCSAIEAFNAYFLCNEVKK